jgi:hypothetical protein
MTWLTRMNGFIILLCTNLIAVILVIFGGIIIGSMYDQFYTGRMFQSIPADWQSASGVYSFINLYYYACIIIALSGWVIFVISIYQREGIDTQNTYYVGRP